MSLPSVNHAYAIILHVESQRVNTFVSSTIGTSTSELIALLSNKIYTSSYHRGSCSGTQNISSGHNRSGYSNNNHCGSNYNGYSNEGNYGGCSSVVVIVIVTSLEITLISLNYNVISITSRYTRDNCYKLHGYPSNFKAKKKGYSVNYANNIPPQESSNCSAFNLETLNFSNSFTSTSHASVFTLEQYNLIIQMLS